MVLDHVRSISNVFRTIIDAIKRYSTHIFSKYSQTTTWECQSNNIFSANPFFSASLCIFPSHLQSHDRSNKVCWPLSTLLLRHAAILGLLVFWCALSLSTSYRGWLLRRKWGWCIGRQGWWHIGRKPRWLIGWNHRWHIGRNHNFAGRKERWLVRGNSRRRHMTWNPRRLIRGNPRRLIRGHPRRLIGGNHRGLIGWIKRWLIRRRICVLRHFCPGMWQQQGDKQRCTEKKLHCLTIRWRFDRG